MKKIIVISIMASLLAGCSNMSTTEKGALLGGGGGALVGGALGGKKGAVLGGVAGAVGGGVVGHKMDDDDEKESE
jgi:uncharacterized protein YcfJ